jgi:hypothetical protein
MTYAIEAEQLVKQYAGRGGDVEAVRGVDLHGRRSSRDSRSWPVPAR